MNLVFDLETTIKPIHHVMVRCLLYFMLLDFPFDLGLNLLDILCGQLPNFHVFVIFEPGSGLIFK